MLTLLLAGAVLALWPLYRRVLRGIGLAFVLFGLALGAVAAAGGDQDPSEIASFLLGGAALRVVGGFRPRAALRRRLRRAPNRV